MAVKTFAAGEILTASDTNTYLANSGLVYVSSTTVGTGVSTVAVSNCFSATYNSYKVVWNGGNLSSTNLLSCYMGAATGTAYYGARSATSTAGAAALVGDNNTGSWIYAAAGNTDFSTFSVEFHNPFLAKATLIDSLYMESSGALGRYVGYLLNTTSYTGFTLDPNGAGTMSGGTVTVYGYRKA